MGSPEMVWEGLYDQIADALTNASLNPSQVGIDWPTKPTLDNLSTGINTTPVISIFDRGSVDNITKAIGLDVTYLENNGVTGCGLTGSATTMAPSAPLTLTGSGVPFVNDCLFLNFPSTVGGANLFAEYIAQQGDSLATALSNLATAINALDGFTATSDSTTITVSTTNHQLYGITTGVYNIGTRYTEVERDCREIQIIVWTKTHQDRTTYGTVIQQLLASLQYNYGFQLADNSWCRILKTDDTIHKDLQLNDIYRRDFLVTADYAILLNQPVYPVATTPIYLNQ